MDALVELLPPQGMGGRCLGSTLWRTMGMVHGMSPMTVSFSRRFFVQAFSLGLFVSAYVSPYKYDFHKHGIEDIENHITITDKTSLKKSKWRTVYDSFL